MCILLTWLAPEWLLLLLFTQTQLHCHFNVSCMYILTLQGTYQVGGNCEDTPTPEFRSMQWLIGHKNVVIATKNHAAWSCCLAPNKHQE